MNELIAIELGRYWSLDCQSVIGLLFIIYCYFLLQTVDILESNMTDYTATFKEKGKGMLEEGAIYAAGGALIGLLLDKIFKSENYEYTKGGILVGGVVGASAGAHSSGTAAISKT